MRSDAFWGPGMARRNRLDVLLIDDDPATSRLLGRLLMADYCIHGVRSVCDALAFLDVCKPAVLVMNLETDGGAGKYVLAAVADHDPSVRRLVYSAAPRLHLRCLIEAGLAHAAVEKSQRWLDLANEVRRLAADSRSRFEARDSIGSLDVPAVCQTK